MADGHEHGPSQSICLDTASGNPIQNVRPAVVQMPLAGQGVVASIKPPSIVRTPPDHRYNCHGLTFASRRAGIPDEVDVGRILEEDGYLRILNRADVVPGDVAVYFNDDDGVDHSGIVVRNDGPLFMPLICSKFGWFGPEVIHAAATPHASYAITDIRFYRIGPP